MSVRRNFMNVVRNYTEAEVKVREATSNDAWGPSSSLMCEIADMTYNVVAFSEIMSMIWKRINDHGKNWRHVYKALTLLDYLIKTGSERVAQQCKENIFAIQTLKDFQFLDRDGKDQGLNVREKSKQLVILLKDEERLKTERARAIKAKERFAQSTTGIGSNQEVAYGHGSLTPQTHRTPEARHTTLGTTASTSLAVSSAASTEIEQARPQTAGEEEMQLQLALAMSKEEAEQEKKVGDSDDIRLKIALSKSAEEAKTSDRTKNESSLLELTTAVAQLDGPWGSQPMAKPQQPDPWGFNPTPTQPQHAADPWTGLSQPVVVANPDPWSGISLDIQPKVKPEDMYNDKEFDAFASLAKDTTTAKVPSTSTNLLEVLDTLGLNGESGSLGQDSGEKPKKSANDFLGEAKDLVNLDSLIPVQNTVNNPFFMSTNPTPAPSYQFPPQPTQPSMNQLRGNPSLAPTIGTTAPVGSNTGSAPGTIMNPTPYAMQPTAMMNMPAYSVPAPMTHYGMMSVPPPSMVRNENMMVVANQTSSIEKHVGTPKQDKSNPFLL